MPEHRTPPRAADFLRGQSPRERGIEKTLRCINWIYRWGFSSASIINAVAGAAKPVVAKLEKAGLIRKTRTEAGGITRDTPQFYYTLTDAGLAEAQRFEKNLIRYPESDQYKVNQLQIRHYLIAQHATITALKNGSISDFRTERQFDGDGDKPGEKRPDIIWVLPGGAVMALEIELTAKWDRKLDEFLRAIILGTRTNKDKPARFNFVGIISDSHAIIERYRAAMQPDAPLKIWKKNQRGHWEVERTAKVPAEFIAKVKFIEI